MSSRRNYLDADNSIMERNLRFVKNDLEDNLNQYFGGSGSRGNNSTTVTAPPRDYKVVQPKPGGSHAHAQSFGLEKRRGFLLQLGLARHEAYELAKHSDFDVNRYEQKCEEWLDRGIRQAEVNHKILSEIRNENTWNNNVGHNDYEMSQKTPTVPFTPTCIEERDNLNSDRGYSQIYEERSCRNRSRSRSHSYDPQSHDYREERHHQSMYERKNEEYFSKQVNSRDAVKRDVIREGSGPRICSPSRSDRRGERYQSSRSRSPNRAINTMRERRNEEYVLQHDHFRPEIGRDTMRQRSRSYSPPTNYRREERSRSPNRGFHNRDGEEYYVRQDNYSVDVRRDTIHEKSHLAPRNDSRDERYQSARSRSPNRGFNLVQERESDIFLIERDNFRTIRERSRSRPYSPPRNDHREEFYQSTRSRSPTRDFSDRNPSEYFSQPENFRKTIRERSLSRAYSPPINDRREEFYQSSNSRSPNRALNSRNNRRSEDFRNEIRRDAMGFAPSPSTAARFPSENKNKYGNTQRGPNSSRNIPTQQNREIPSLLALDTFPIQTKSSHAHNIPSLLTLQVFPDQNNVQQPSTSGKGNRYNNESNRKQIPQYGNNKKSKFNNNKGKTQQIKKEPNANSQSLREHVSKIPIIQCGLAKPPPGHLKANPKEYWSQWWPQYKYIEYSVPKINPKDNEVKTCINFMFKPHELEFRRSKHMLLGKGVNAIMKTVDINETNYYVRDIYKLFKYKKHLEDPNFLNNLDPQDLNCIAPALRQFKIKSTMAFLHQALICRWHISLDIIKKVQAGEPIRSNYARILLNEKCFHYLVMESIQELKKMCQQDWPQFAEFYKNIKATKVDIYALGVGPNLEASSNANFVYKMDADDEYDDRFCIKSFKVNTNEKYFINVCQTEEIPSPEDISETELSAILNSEEPSSFRIPMSISEPRTTKDKSNNAVDAVDIAINPKFFIKIEKSLLFRDFFLALIAEALNDKYNVQIKVDKAIILNNRKFIGTLVSHRVRNNDVKTVLNSYKNPSKEDVEKLKSLEEAAIKGPKSLVQEIDVNELKALKQKTEQVKQQQSTDSVRIKKEISQAASTMPDYKLRARIKNEAVEEVQAEFYLPKCISSHELTLDIGEDRILLESMKHGYLFDKFVNYRLNQERARAIFDKTNKMLQIRIPVITA